MFLSPSIIFPFGYFHTNTHAHLYSFPLQCKLDQTDRYLSEVYSRVLEGMSIVVFGKRVVFHCFLQNSSVKKSIGSNQTGPS